MYLSVRDTPFFKDIISIADCNVVNSLFVERHYPKGSVVFMQGDEGNSMYIIKSGALKIYRHDENREIIFGHQFPGQVIGELEAIHYDNRRIASVAAIEKTTLWMITKPDLEKLIKLYPEILRKAFYIVSERLGQADRKIEYLAFLDTRVRVANLLLDLNSNFGTKTEVGILINWKTTQQHLANMIGIGRESTARVLQEFQNEGLILIQNKQIYILELETIQKLAGPEQDSFEGRKWHSTHKYII